MSLVYGGGLLACPSCLLTGFPACTLILFSLVFRLQLGQNINVFMSLSSTSKHSIAAITSQNKATVLILMDEALQDLASRTQLSLPHAQEAICASFSNTPRAL